MIPCSLCHLFIYFVKKAVKPNILLTETVTMYLKQSYLTPRPKQNPYIGPEVSAVNTMLH